MNYSTRTVAEALDTEREQAMAHTDWWDENFPEWREQSEAPAWEAEPTEWPSVSDADWEAISEALWCDPAERVLD